MISAAPAGCATSVPEPREPSLLAAIDGRAAAADRGELDLSADVEALRAAGWLQATLPTAADGRGWGTEPAGTAACFAALRELGRVSLPVARLFEGHVNAIALVARYGSAPLQREAFDRVRGGACLGVWGADAPDEPVSLTDAAGGPQLKGAKDYASGMGILSHAVISVRVAGGTQLLLAPVGEASRSDETTWRLAGMRATRSGRYRFDGVGIDAGARIGGPDDWFREPHFEGGVWRYCAAHLGAAERLYLETRDALAARGRADDPHQQARLVRIAIAIETSRLWIERAAGRTQAAHAEPEAATVSLLAREVTQEACRDVIRAVEEALGLAAHTRGPVERMRRDLAAFVCQAAPDAKRARAAEALVTRAVLPEDL